MESALANALSGFVRRKRLSAAQSVQLWQLWQIWQAVPIRLRAVDMRSVVDLAGNLQIYAYDAFFLQCALETSVPLLTLDRRMKAEAAKNGIRTLE